MGCSEVWWDGVRCREVGVVWRSGKVESFAE